LAPPAPPIVTGITFGTSGHLLARPSAPWYSTADSPIPAVRRRRPVKVGLTSSLLLPSIPERLVEFLRAQICTGVSSGVPGVFLAPCDGLVEQGHGGLFYRGGAQKTRFLSWAAYIWRGAISQRPPPMREPRRGGAPKTRASRASQPLAWVPPMGYQPVGRYGRVSRTAPHESVVDQHRAWLLAGPTVRLATLPSKTEAPASIACPVDVAGGPCAAAEHRRAAWSFTDGRKPIGGRGYPQ